MKTAITTIGLATLLFAVVMLFHLMSLDGVDGWIYAHLLGDDTRYSAQYRDSSFKRVHTGMSENDVHATLGDPLMEVWIYRQRAVSLPTVNFVHDRVTHVEPGPISALEAVTNGMSKSDVRKKVGEPLQKSLVYSESPRDGSYRVRVILLAGDRVVQKKAKLYVD